MTKKLSYEKLLAESTCSVGATVDKSGELASVVIEFGGALAAIPSTSNSKQIIQRQGYRPLLVNSFSAQTKLKAMTAAFNNARSRILYKLLFSEPVTVQVLLSKRKGRYDSHNFSKTVGDWLEKIGVIENDTHAEIHCFKKVDYERFESCLDTTIIEIRRRREARQIWEQASKAHSANIRGSR